MRGALREFLRSRVLKLSFSVLMLTASVLFTADVLDLRGDQSRGLRDARKLIAETLAVQLSTLASVYDSKGVQHSVRSFVTRNVDVSAAALVDADGMEIAAYGQAKVLNSVSKNSSLNHMTVPIFDGSQRWGEVRVAFAPQENLDIQYFAFVLAGCLLSYMLFLRKALAQLNPGKVVPGRVNSAFDMLSEGVVILDDKLRVLLANESVAESIGKTTGDLVGQELSDWNWEQSGDWQAPWATALHSGLNVPNQPLRLRLNDDEVRTYMVSCATIGNEEEGMRGVLVTLDDMTAVEQKNTELAATLRQLRRSQEDISKKNKELQELATHDALTGLANRRALIANFEEEFTRPTKGPKKLSCIMVDIDRFKRINDTLGHAVGDEVICAVANVLVRSCRDTGMVGRYGGEEFVVVLPNMAIAEATEIAEQLRSSVAAMATRAEVPVAKLSASFGISEFDDSVESPLDMLAKADQALYAAKQAGRNRVQAYDPKISKLAISTTDETLVPDANVDEAMLSRLVELEAMVDERTNDIRVLREFDTLTGIPKRTLFLRRIENEIRRAQRFQTSVGVLSMELKDMDRIISSLGHAASDALVVDVVERLQEGLRDTDAVSEVTDEYSLSRIMSNEYGILLSDLDDVGHTMPVVTRLRKLLAKPFVIEGQKVYVGANIGIALFPQGGEEAVELMENASLARAKAASMPDKVSHSFASARLDEESKRYVQLESDLYDAFEKGEFEVHYQPIYDVVKRRVSGLEALLRWHHPDDGYIPPDEFIGMAEANGLIQDISKFVLGEALTQISAWREMGMDDLRVSINISPTQLRSSSLVNDLVGAIQDAGLPKTCLEIELTESSVIDSPQRARIVLGQLRDAGVRVSMDDFGTGYSSLALLADLPLDSVKIDRSFVAALSDNERSRSIVEAVINMAQALKLMVVGEGVETNEQLETLTALGCHEVQGYLISRPLPAKGVTEFLRQQDRGRAGAL